MVKAYMNIEEVVAIMTGSKELSQFSYKVFSFRDPSYTLYEAFQKIDRLWSCIIGTNIPSALRAVKKKSSIPTLISERSFPTASSLSLP